MLTSGPIPVATPFWVNVSKLGMPCPPCALSGSVAAPHADNTLILIRTQHIVHNRHLIYCEYPTIRITQQRPQAGAQGRGCVDRLRLRARGQDARHSAAPPAASAGRVRWP